jgi:hypothetical protein
VAQSRAATWHPRIGSLGYLGGQRTGEFVLTNSAAGGSCYPFGVKFI